MTTGLTFDEAAHEYRLDGAPLLSVTQVLSLAGLVDYSGVDSDLLAYRAQQGKLAHLACELDDLGDLDESSVAPEIAGYLAGYRKFKSETGFKPALIEHRVLHRTYMFCGTLDRTGSIGERRLLLDLKTSLVPQPAWGVQLAGYQLALDDGEYERAALRITKDGKYHLDTYRDTNDRKMFLAALAVAQWRRAYAK